MKIANWIEHAFVQLAARDQQAANLGLPLPSMELREVLALDVEDDEDGGGEPTPVSKGYAGALTPTKAASIHTVTRSRQGVWNCTCSMSFVSEAAPDGRCPGCGAAVPAAA